MAAPRKKADASTEGVAPEQDPPAEETPVVPPEPDDSPKDDSPKDGEPDKDKIKILNPGQTSVVYTDDGRQIAAGERLEVEALDGTGETALERGYITKID